MQTATIKLNVWQAAAVAQAMREHDDAWRAAHDATEDNLRSAYATVELIEVDRERIVFVTFEDDGSRRALWHDGSDVTDDYA